MWLTVSFRAAHIGAVVEWNDLHWEVVHVKGPWPDNPNLYDVRVRKTTKEVTCE